MQHESLINPTFVQTNQYYAREITIWKALIKGKKEEIKYSADNGNYYCDDYHDCFPHLQCIYSARQKKIAGSSFVIDFEIRTHLQERRKFIAYEFKESTYC